MTAQAITEDTLVERFRASLRRVAGSVFLVTTTDESGRYHGIAVTSAASLSMAPPSMFFAANKSSSIHPILLRTGRFCLNLLADTDEALLQAFSRSDQRARRFSPEHWHLSACGLPVLRGALATQICRIDATHEYGTHTVFFGRVEQVILAENAAQPPRPMIWLNGARASAAAKPEP